MHLQPVLQLLLVQLHLQMHYCKLDQRYLVLKKLRVGRRKKRKDVKLKKPLRWLARPSAVLKFQ
jgi:hypothetical protein